MREVVARRCSAKEFSEKFHKMHREILVLQSLSNTAKELEAVRFATLLKRDLAPLFQSQPFVDCLQNKCS